MTGESVPHPNGAPQTRPSEGEEIVHSRGKPRGRVNPLVLGSNPSGPTTFPEVDRPRAARDAAVSRQQSPSLWPASALLNSTLLPSIELDVVIKPRSIVVEKVTVPVVVSSSVPEHCIVKRNSRPT